MLNILKKFFGDKHQKDIKILEPIVEEINAIYDGLKDLSDDQLREETQKLRVIIDERTQELRNQIQELENKLKEDHSTDEIQTISDELDKANEDLDELYEDVLDEILPRAFAIVKDTCRRLVGKSWDVVGRKITWDMIPYDVQLIGGIVLHQGKIAEMATGEGKTLVATLPLLLNALTGRGCHLVTVNDYLAQRDSEWMGKIFEFHGLTVGVILNTLPPEQRKKMYRCDITYGTNNEFGFDYLRDNMTIDSEGVVQRVHNYAIVDEVDSVLVDEARTPLIISGPVESSEQKFTEIKPRVERLVRGQSSLVAKIVQDAENLMNAESPDLHNAGILLLRAHRGFPKNKKLMKILSEPSNKRLMQETENEYLREREKRMHEIDDELYFRIEEKNHSIELTEKGCEFITSVNEDKDFFVLPDLGTEISKFENNPSLTTEEIVTKKDQLYKLYAQRSDRIHTVNQLLRAYTLYEKDDEYVVSDDGKVMIVDEFTGRLLSGRRYSDGLHQAIEAKENVKVEKDSQTLATITLQNYFRLYKKLAGMTGTAETEAGEFWGIYKLDVVVIPTNRDCIREDINDLIYRTVREKYNALMDEVEDLRKQGRPVLVGTTSVEVSETISRMLKRKGIQHSVLNAKQHQHEAEIVANAGLRGAITIATNMAGRGTDIKLGPGVKEAGGLAILGTTRHEARRIDRQLRGRSGRQGDAGSSKFYLSLEDDLMRLFGSDRVASIMQRMGIQEGEVITHAMITRSVERAQKKVEENNFAIRKRLLEYDNVMNSQREVIYSRRKQALRGERLKSKILDDLREYIGELVNRYYDEADIDSLKEELIRNCLIDLQISPQEFQDLGADGLSDKINQAAIEFYKKKEEMLLTELMANLERYAVLSVIDEKWKEHLRDMDDLKEGIGLRAYGQKDPLVEYKNEAYKLFVDMLHTIRDETIKIVFKWFPETPEQMQQRRRASDRVVATHAATEGLGLAGDRGPVRSGSPATAGKPQPVSVGVKIGRNDPCSCGSGKKYKHCHGA
ncbi:MAG: preprotein translocase subunit SecA [Bacteroidetes bacterium]|nr:preprotein translocase subunit SecA [Bacteroidota bacterium]